MSDISPVQDTDKNLDTDVARISEKRGPLWRNRDFLLLMSGQTVSSVGSQVSLLAFPLLILALTHSPAQAGIITSLRGLAFGLICLPAGAWVDRLNRKRMMILCDLGRAIALGSIPLAFAFGGVSLIQLYAVSLVEGTLFAFFNLAETACLPRVVSKEQLPTASAVDQVSYAASGLIGPALSGVLYSIAITLPFLADAISYAVSVFSLAFIKTEFQGKRNTTSSKLWVEVLEGMKWLWHQPLLSFIAVLTFGLTTPCVGYALILIVLAQHMHASNFVIGLIFAGGGAGSILGALVVIPIQKRFSFGQAIIGASWIWALSWLLIALAPDPFVLGVANALGFIIVPVYAVVQYSYRIALIPDHLQGRVNSVFRLITFGSQPLGLILTGVLLQAIGAVPTVLLLFVPQLVLSIAATLNGHVRRARPIEEVG
jgi:MFS family permease